jgi:hypothetical protein
MWGLKFFQENAGRTVHHAVVQKLADYSFLMIVVVNVAWELGMGRG